MIVCIQCALRAIVNGTPYKGEGDETLEAHMLRCHPDLEATRRERRELEAKIYELEAKLSEWLREVAENPDPRD